jgi:hypothetical protein
LRHHRLLVLPAVAATVLAAGVVRAQWTNPVHAETAPASVRVCPQRAAPIAACFAEVRVDVKRGKAGAAPQGWGPADLRSAYSLPSSGGNGATIAVVDAFHAPTVETDLAVYRLQFGLPACTTLTGCLTVVNQNGAASPPPATSDPGWAMETALDLQMASAICPDCKLLLVEATTPDLGDLGTGVDSAVRLGAAAVSNSWGTLEFSQERDYEAHFNHPGTAITVSAGDFGYGVAYPAASQFVTAVGGTTLTRSGSNWAETVWGGTGAGCSAYISKPGWQNDPNCPTRMMNDVAAVADPETGVAVYDTYQADGWYVIGGTSASAPVIAAAYALTGATARVQSGSTPWLTHGSGGFRDITSGTNVPGGSSATCGGDYLCTGLPGYDGPTGWGSPVGLTGLTPPG